MGSSDIGIRSGSIGVRCCRISIGGRGIGVSSVRVGGAGGVACIVGARAFRAGLGRGCGGPNGHADYYASSGGTRSRARAAVVTRCSVVGRGSRWMICIIGSGRMICISCLAIRSNGAVSGVMCGATTICVGGSRRSRSLRMICRATICVGSGGSLSGGVGRATTIGVGGSRLSRSLRMICRATICVGSSGSLSGGVGRAATVSIGARGGISAVAGGTASPGVSVCLGVGRSAHDQADYETCQANDHLFHGVISP